MRYLAPVTAALLFGLSATPALADVATPEPGRVAEAAVNQALAALQTLNSVIEEGVTGLERGGSAALVRSNGPSTAPGTSLGADSSPSFTGIGGGTAPSGSNPSSREEHSAPVEGFPAVFPNPGPLGVAPVVVGSGVVVTPADVSGIATNPQVPQTVVAAVPPQAISPVPAPPALLLLASALIGFLPSRRSTRCLAG